MCQAHVSQALSEADAHTFASLLLAWGCPGSARPPVKFHVPMHNPARPVMEGSASLKMLLPRPLCKCLWRLTWHIPSRVSAGDAQRQRCLYRLRRVKFMGQPPAALCNNVICSLCSWLLPKTTHLADFCHCRKKNVLCNA